MPIKTDYSPVTDPSKQLSRLAVRSFVDVHIPRRERAETKMACFPSVGFHDVYEISDPLGIPRRNVTGIESDPEIYEIMEKKNPGINLFHGTDREFFEKADDFFRLISLDYTDKFSIAHTDTLDILFGRHVLGERGVLHTNYYGSRETEGTKNAYTDVIKQMFASQVVVGYVDTVEKSGDLTGASAVVSSEISKTKSAVQELKLSAMRNLIASNIISSACSGGYRMLIAKIRKEKPKGSEIVDFEYFLRRISSTGAPRIVGTYVMETAVQPYFCNGLESYRYVSSSGSPMLTDIFDFNTHPELYENCNKLDIRPDGVFLKGVRVDEFSEHPMIKSFIGRANRSLELYQRSFGLVKERKFLGSSAKPILSKEKARKLVARGVPSEETLKTYRGVTRQQLAAYKAWKTREDRTKSI